MSSREDMTNLLIDAKEMLRLADVAVVGSNNLVSKVMTPPGSTVGVAMDLAMSARAAQAVANNLVGLIERLTREFLRQRAEAED